MEALFRTHAYLVEHTPQGVRRALMDEIDWTDRLIGIKGSRGVGKTTFLLQYAREHYGAHNRQCLYINMNNFYFQGKTISEFASEFCKAGGRVLLIDQVFKEPDWSHQLRLCFETLPQLRIVFTGSSVMRLKEENPELNGIVRSYNLRGFSFREYLNLQTGLSFKAHTLDEILTHHTQLTAEICQRVNPLHYFSDYLHHGYYPFFLEQTNFSENLLKVMNMMIEVDILLIQQIELKYLSRIKKLFYLLATGEYGAPNVSQLAQEVHTSRATTTNYIKYLSDARLINIQYRSGDTFPKKPARLMMHNTNLMHAMTPHQVKTQEAVETFFQNALWSLHTVNVGDRNCTYLVDNQHRFRIATESVKRKAEGVYYVLDGINRGYGCEIPLWLFGFLY
ncbi:MAG: ATP-binding protein [Bacteroidaceae bacterium]|nr:ATP-binding protein [Bacteroidaceae bacterium]